MDRSDITVHSRIATRHPELSESDIVSAWNNAFAMVERTGGTLPDTVLVAVGSDANGRLLEMVAVVQNDGGVCVFHAMTPPSGKTLAEIGLAR